MDIISKIFLAENATCIYRNFSVINRKRKIFAVICIIFELVFMIYGFFNLYSFLKDGMIKDVYPTVIFNCLSKMYTVLVICLGFTNAEAYTRLCYHINAVYDQIIMSNEIQASLKKVKIYGLVMIVIFVTSNTVMLARFVYDLFSHGLLFKRESTFEMFSSIIGIVQFLFIEYRYFIELLSVIILINIVSVSFKFLNLTIVKISNIIENADLEVDCAHGSMVSGLKKKIEKCAAVAHHTSVCSDQLTKCFSVQIASALFIAIIFLIAVVYKGINSCISQAERERLGSSNSILLLSNYVSVPIVMMYAGQAVQNEAHQFVKSLARLQNTLLPLKGEGMADLKKSVNNFHRQMLVNPVGIKILSQVCLHMPMFPDIASAIITYTIILLQFNHVL